MRFVERGPEDLVEAVLWSRWWPRGFGLVRDDVLEELGPAKGTVEARWTVSPGKSARLEIGPLARAPEPRSWEVGPLLVSISPRGTHGAVLEAVAQSDE